MLNEVVRILMVAPSSRLLSDGVTAVQLLQGHFYMVSVADAMRLMVDTAAVLDEASPSARAFLASEIEKINDALQPAETESLPEVEATPVEGES